VTKASSSTAVFHSFCTSPGTSRRSYELGSEFFASLKLSSGRLQVMYRTNLSSPSFSHTLATAMQRSPDCHSINWLLLQAVINAAA
jgi:hypothetical protein